MPYELETARSNHKFLNATQITILLSLGLHLLIYQYSFSTSLFKEKSTNKDKTVATIELNPSEQARLPNLDSEWNAPTFQQTPLTEAAAPFALPLPPNFTPNPNLPPIQIPPGYQLPNIPSISSNIKLPPLGITDLSALPSPPPLKDLDSITPPNVPLTTPEKPSEKPKEEAEIAPPPKTPDRQKPETSELDKPTPQQIAAVREQKLQGDIRAVSKSLRKQDGETTDEEARKNYVNWLSKIENAQPESLEIKGIYPKDACIRKLEGTSVYGVVVDEKNEVVALELIKGAKYPIFNEKASEDIQKHDFADDSEEIRPYQVSVEYKYDAEICPSLSLPSLGKKEESETEVKPKPETEAENPTQPESETEVKPKPETEAENPTQPESETEVKPKPETEAENPTQPESETEVKPKPETETQPKPESSIRERLQNTPLPNNDNIRERLRNNPLPN